MHTLYYSAVEKATATAAAVGRACRVVEKKKKKKVEMEMEDRKAILMIQTSSSLTMIVE